MQSLTFEGGGASWCWRGMTRAGTCLPGEIDMLLRGYCVPEGTILPPHFWQVPTLRVLRFLGLQGLSLLRIKPIFSMPPRLEDLLRKTLLYGPNLQSRRGQLPTGLYCREDAQSDGNANPHHSPTHPLTHAGHATHPHPAPCQHSPALAHTLSTPDLTTL